MKYLTILLVLIAVNAKGQDRNDYVSMYVGNAFGQGSVYESFGDQKIRIRANISPLIGYEYGLRLFNNLYLNGGLGVCVSNTVIRYTASDTLIPTKGQKLSALNFGISAPLIFTYRLKIVPRFYFIPGTGFQLTVYGDEVTGGGSSVYDGQIEQKLFWTQVNEHGLGELNLIGRLGMEYRFSEKVGLGIIYSYAFGSTSNAYGYYNYYTNNITTSAGNYAIDHNEQALSVSIVLTRG